jgi:transcription antitermination factor NusG
MSKQWYVLYVKSRQELKINARLQKAGFHTCCPVRTERRQWSDRIKKLKVPLLPSMILVHLENSERASVFDVPGVLRFLFWMQAPAVVRNEEVEILEGLNHHKIKSHEILPLVPGDEIDLSPHGFTDQKGIIEKKSNKQYWVLVKQLGFKLKLTLD